MRCVGAARRPGLWRAVAIAWTGGLLLSALLASPVAASHDWAHSYYKTFVENGTWDLWRISNYTDSDANNNRAYPWAADYLHARYDISQSCFGCDPLIRVQAATCGPAANSCERVVTNASTVVIDFDYYFLRSFHCGVDDVNGVRHETPQEVFLGACAQQARTGAHLHQLQFK